MTLIRPCRQSTVLGTRIALAPSGTDWSSSLQMITVCQYGMPACPFLHYSSPIDTARGEGSRTERYILGRPLRAVTCAKAF